MEYRTRPMPVRSPAIPVIPTATRMVFRTRATTAPASRTHHRRTPTGTRSATSAINVSDGDGVCEQSDLCPTVADPQQLDTDDDGVGDACDNCPELANPAQADCDANQIGDPCDVAFGNAPDCNANDRPDSCDLASRYSADLDGDACTRE